MKKLIFGALLLGATTFSFAKTADTSLNSNPKVELNSNMKLVVPGQESTLDDMTKVYDLGICDVYIDGVYVGTYHVYVITP